MDTLLSNTNGFMHLSLFHEGKFFIRDGAGKDGLNSQNNVFGDDFVNGITKGDGTKII